MYSQSWHHACAPPPMTCWYPVCWMPMVWPEPCEQVLVREIAADATTPTKSTLTGGRGKSRLTVEYYVASGASSPSVTLTIAADGQTTTWNDTNIAVGYHVHEELTSVHAGAMVTLSVTSATARVRWCERVCC
ncbi:MAG: hypothetical protein ACREFP_12475 [Acetobacteraceae bacterium]